MKHTDLTQHIINDDDCTAPLECYFDDYTMSLWFVYVNDVEIINFMSDTVIKSLERQYEQHVTKERREHNLSFKIDRYESSLLDQIMGM